MTRRVPNTKRARLRRDDRAPPKDTQAKSGRRGVEAAVKEKPGEVIAFPLEPSEAIYPIDSLPEPPS
jgi:hypothetical protein